MWVITLATMTIGNIVAISQTNIKRMLAYSSIAHAGYILVAFVAGNDLGTSGILFYLMAYAFMNLGAFTCVILLGKKGEENTLINDYAGIGFKYPLLAASMTIFLLSMAGNSSPGWIHGKILCLQRCREIKILLAGHPWGIQQRHFRLLLPSGHRAHVFQGIGTRDHGPPVFLGLCASL